MVKFGRKQKSDLSSRLADESFDVASFRRGTTLSTFRSDKAEKSERKRLKDLRALRRRMIELTVVVMGLLTVGVALLSQYTGSLSGVKADDGVQLSETDQQHYLDIVNKYYQENSFDRFSFARRTSVLNNYVKGQAPEVAEVKIRASGIMSSRVELKFRQPVAQWVSGVQTSFVDANGVVFQRNYFAAPAISIEDNSGAKGVDGMATSANFLSFVGQTSVQLQKQGLKIQRVVIPRGAARYVEIYLEGRKYPFKAQITRNAVGQAADIAAMVRYIDARSLNPSYVDTRVAGKAFWR